MNTPQTPQQDAARLRALIATINVDIAHIAVEHANRRVSRRVGVLSSRGPNPEGVWHDQRQG
jgi:hypothetical protein